MSTTYEPDDIEYYNNVDELLLEDDIIETDIKIAGWNKKFRIRALTFGQMGNINSKSTKDDGTQDEKLFVLQTIVEGVVRPKFNSTQAEKLLEKNGEFVRQLADDIWSVGRLSKTVFNNYIEELKKSNEAETKNKNKK